MSPDRLEGYAGEDFARQNFDKLAVDSVNWQTLYRDPRSGEYWKEYSPYPEAHGGGPPSFVKITKEQAEIDFKIKL